MSEENKRSRLPPPAFPPGFRKHLRKHNWGGGAPDDLGGALISPDAPIPERDHSVEDALISPDDPMPERKEPSEDTVIPSIAPRETAVSPNDPTPHRDAVSDSHGLPQFEAESGVVTGMGVDDRADVEQLATGGDPYMMDLVRKVGTLSDALRAKGEAGLRSSPDMDRFEATLRGYCVGYLAGRRAEDDPSSDY